MEEGRTVYQAETLEIIEVAKRTRKSRHESSMRIRNAVKKGKAQMKLSSVLTDALSLSVGDKVFVSYVDGNLFVAKHDGLLSQGKLVSGNKLDSGLSEAVHERIGDYCYDTNLDSAINLNVNGELIEGFVFEKVGNLMEEKINLNSVDYPMESISSDVDENEVDSEDFTEEIQAISDSENTQWVNDNTPGGVN